MNLINCIEQSGDDEEILRLIIAHFNADSGTVHLVGEDGHLHLATASAGLPPQVIDAIRTIPIGKGMAGLAVDRRQPVNACNIQTDGSGDVRPGARATNLAGAIVVPMMRGEEAVGALGIANSAERTFTQEEVDELMEAGRSIAARRAATL